MVRKALKEEILAMAIMKRASPVKYGPLQKNLRNSYLLGKNEYPTNVADVLKVLNNYTPEYKPGDVPSDDSPSRTSSTNQGADVGTVNTTGTTSVSFLQANGTVHKVKYLRGTNNSFFKAITCRICKFKGHYQTHCPVANSSGNKVGSGTSNSNGSNDTSNRADTSTATTTGAASSSTASEQEVSTSNCGILLSQHIDKAYINPRWVLLDSESTDHIFCNNDLLTDVHSTTDGEYLRLHTSGGTLDSTQKGKFGGFDVWYNPNCLANVLSLALVTEKYRVTMDSIVKNAFNVHISERHTIQFVCVQPGLYLLDTTNVDIHKLRHAFSFLTTVEQNKSLFQCRKLKKQTRPLSSTDEQITLLKKICLSDKRQLDQELSYLSHSVGPKPLLWRN